MGVRGDEAIMVLGDAYERRVAGVRVGEVERESAFETLPSGARNRANWGRGDRHFSFATDVDGTTAYQ
jgi:hypothetical protein